MDSQLLSLLTALLGAAAGSLGTWLVARYRDREREANADRALLQDKVHQLEIRIVRMERDIAFYLTAGSRRIQEGLDAQQA